MITIVTVLLVESIDKHRCLVKKFNVLFERKELRVKEYKRKFEVVAWESLTQ